MPLSQQARLLRVLQEREITRLGSNKVTPIDVRVIAATNRDLKESVRRGTFREDLYYRLCVLTLQIPPLRERKEDIPLLVQYFVDQFSPERKLRISPEIMRQIASYSWPGNIRELRNFCERAAVLGDGEIDQSLIHQLLPDQAVPRQAEEPPISGAPPAGQGEDDLLILLEALRQCGGNKTQAAAKLGISRVTLWRRLREFGLS